MAGTAGVAGGLTLRAAGGPLHVDGLIAHLGPRAVPGMEEVDGATYRRVLRLPGGNGVAAVRLSARGARGTLWLERDTDRASARRALRDLLALDAPGDEADVVLGRDPALAPLVAAAPGVRVPGTPDGAELAIRAVLGQQISVAAARTAAAGLAAGLGRPLPAPDGTLTHAFPSPAALADAPDELLRMPRSRQRTVRILATELAAGDLDVRRGADPTALRAALRGTARHRSVDRGVRGDARRRRPRRVPGVGPRPAALGGGAGAAVGPPRAGGARRAVAAVPVVRGPTSVGVPTPLDSEPCPRMTRS